MCIRDRSDAETVKQELAEAKETLQRSQLDLSNLKRNYDTDTNELREKKDNQIESIIFVPKKDKLKEIWDGFREGPEGAVSNYKFDSAFNVDEIHEIIPDLLHGKHKVFYAFGKKEGFDEDVIDWTLKANKKDRHSQSIELADSTSIIGNMRLIKDDHEINIIKKACEIFSKILGWVEYNSNFEFYI